MAPPPKPKPNKPLPTDMDLAGAAAFWGVTHWSVRAWVKRKLLVPESRLELSANGQRRNKSFLVKGTSCPELKIGRPKSDAA